jgi:hypothetical protein
MMALWPVTGKAKYLIGYIEGSRESIGTFPNGAIKYNPSVQGIHLGTGAVETILRGMNGCDGIRSTSWGTILVT